MRKKTFEELLDDEYGLEGSQKRNAFELQAFIFAVSDLIKETRIKSGMTQQQLADKLGMQKSFISRVENGKTDMQLSTIFKILEQGLNQKIIFSIDS